MDSVKKSEELSLKNEAIFNKIFNSNRSAKPILTRSNDSIYTYSLDGNLVYRLGGEGAYLNATWENPEFLWLLNSHFKADYIFNRAGQISFVGEWYDGSFEGYSFRATSKFLGGEFRGQRYEAGNSSFKVEPDNYFSGIWLNPQDGILGVDLLTEPFENTMDSLAIASVPTGWFVTIIGDRGEKISFKVIKKLDDKNTNFIFQVYPNLQKLQVHWETIRADYLNYGFIFKGRAFYLLGVEYVIGNVTSISVTNEAPAERISAKDTIDFSTDPNLKGFLSYKNIAIPIEVNSSTQEGKDFVEQFKKDLPKGVFSDVLKQLLKYITAGSITGFSDDEFIGLAPVFNNIRGGRISNAKIRELMSYLNKFMIYIADESKDFDTTALITESIIKIKGIITRKIKQALKVDKFIKAPNKAKPSVAVASKGAEGVVDDGKTEKERQQDFISGAQTPTPQDDAQKRQDQLKKILKAL